MMVLRNVLLGPHSTFGIGGPASYFAGVGPSVDRDANVFVDDGGFDGLVVRTADSADVEVLEDGRLRARSVRVPETRFGPLERVLAGSLGDDFMLLLAV